jgi:lysozyme
MTPEGRALLFAQEGYRKNPYLDSKGIETVGIGRNLRDVGISLEEAQYLADNDDIALAELALTRYTTFYNRIDPVRQDVFINLWFNMNSKLLGFVKMLAAASIGDWVAAGDELVNSTADHEEPARIETLANILKSGAYNGPGGSSSATS